jgi:hypothetical protein
MAVLHQENPPDPQAENFCLPATRSSYHPNRAFRFHHSRLLYCIQPVEGHFKFLL